MKLVTITFGSVPRLPGLRPTDLGTINLDRPGEALRDWRLVLRGQQAFFISPPGWVPDMSVKRRDPKGPVVIHEVARDELRLQWSATAEEIEMVLKGGKFESPPFGWMPTPVVPDAPLLAQIPRNEIGD